MSKCWRKRGHKGDEGFTLVELLIAVTILPLIIGALTLGIMTVFSLQSSVSNRLSNSSDAQVASSQYQRDIQSATSITVQPSSSPQCGSSTTQLLGLQWPLANGNVAVVSYSEVGAMLVRTYCSAATPLPVTLTPSDTTTMATHIESLAAGQPLPYCVGAASCFTGGWVSAAGVPNVTFGVVETNTTPFTTITLAATPRIYNANSPNSTGGQPFDPLTLIASGATCPQTSSTASLYMSSGAQITVDGGNGPIGVESSCAGSVYEQNPKTALNASTLESNNPNGNSLTLWAGASGPSSETQFATPPPDPFAAYLTAPSIPSTAVLGGCTGTNPVTCTPGNYTDPNETYSNSNGTFNFSASATTPYVFQYPVVLQGQPGKSFNFGSGTYLFEGGLTITANATVNFGTGTYIFEGATSLSIGANSTVSGTQVLFYVPLPSAGGGAVTFASGSSISLTGLPNYLGVTVWDDGASGTTNPLSLGSNTSDIGIGGIYVPYGEVVDTSGGSVTAQFIVANSATISSSGVWNLVGG